MNWLALDIGGANLKRADGLEFARSTPFALWQRPRDLAEEIRKSIAESPPCDRLAVTMTGELADCFESKSEGVRFILSKVAEAADGREVQIYLSDGRLVAPAVAENEPLLAAASNWHALARFAGRFAERGPSLLIDIGSTTCDVIPLLDGQPFDVKTYDTDRLLAGELVYTGVERSPVCGVVHTIDYHGAACPVAQELFATTLDVYLILGAVPGDATRTDTADRRTATRRAAKIRLRRMLCADEHRFSDADAVAAARGICEAQVATIAAAVQKVTCRLPAKVETVVTSGQGEFLTRPVLESLQFNAAVVSLSGQLGPAVSQCATAHALATLAREANT